MSKQSGKTTRLTVKQCEQEIEAAITQYGSCAIWGRQSANYRRAFTNLVTLGRVRFDMNVSAYVPAVRT